MKKNEFYFGSICVLLSILPLILLTNTSIIYEHFNEIVEALGGLMFVTILLIVFGMDDRCLSIHTNLIDTKTRKDFFTVPVMFVIFLTELVIFYFVNSGYVQAHFSTFTTLLGSMVFAFVMYAIFGGNYKITETVDKKNKQSKKKEK